MSLGSGISPGLGLSADMRTPAKAVRPKPRVTQPYKFAAPIKGWIANESLANPTEGGAAALENWFPTATGLRIRSGTQLYATLTNSAIPVRSLFSYLNGDIERLFAANDTSIVDITTISSANDALLGDEDSDILVTEDGDQLGWSSTGGLEQVTGTTSGNWVVVQFATAGGVFLVGVNGKDEAFLYDGAVFHRLGASPTYELAYEGQTTDFTLGAVLTGATSGATGTVVRVDDEGSTGTLHLRNVVGTFVDGETITDAGGGNGTADGAASQIVGAFTGIATSNLSYVWVYKQRLWFVEKNSLNAWYLPVDQVSGAALKFPLGGVLGRGGSLLFGATWSLDSGAEGGLSEQCVFVSTEGEVAVYQGGDPGTADTWSKVGVYRIGRPLGAKAFIRAGGDLVIATDIGFIPLSQAIQRDVAALSPVAVSYPIETAWNERVITKVGATWHCEIWPTRQMVVIALPKTPETPPEMLVANARTGAWARYTGWEGSCLEVFKDRMFFGSVDGKVVEAEVTGSDQGATYTALCIPLFSDMGNPASMKIANTARAVLLAPYPVNDRITMQSDFVLAVPPAPDAAPIVDASVWGLGVWGTAKWGSEATKRAFQNWRSVGGSGSTMAPALQITCGSVPPPRVDLVRIDVTAQTGDVGS